MDWLHKISITCFAASYGVALALEISRVYFRLRFQRYVAVIFAAAGFFAHTVYLGLQTQLDLGLSGVWLGSWAGWCLSGAWVLAAAYLWYSVRKSETVVGIFIIPLVMLLIGVGTYLQSADAFSTSQAKSMWSMIHGSALLLGTVIVSLGFAFGIMYLYQADRLKRKLLTSELFRLPSLEWLQVAMERALWISALMLGLGLVSGIVINSINNEAGRFDTGIAVERPGRLDFGCAVCLVVDRDLLQLRLLTSTTRSQSGLSCRGQFSVPCFGTRNCLVQWSRDFR